MVPERIASLILMSTAPKLFSTIVGTSFPTPRQPFAQIIARAGSKISEIE